MAMLATLASASAAAIGNTSSPTIDHSAEQQELTVASNHAAAHDDAALSHEQGLIDGNKSFILPRCELPPAHEYDPVESFVHKTVLEQNKQANDNVPSKAYKGLLDALRRKTELPLVVKILLALRTSGMGSTLHLLASGPTKHARLIHYLVRFHPFETSNITTTNSDSATEHDENNSDTVNHALADAHLHLLVALVSANSVYLLPTLTALWKMLALEYENMSTHRTQRLHATIASILRLCPKGRTELFAIITANAPYRTRPEAAITWYYQHSLFVLQYLPSIQGQVLEFIVDKCLELDVEIKICDSGEVAIDENDEEMNENDLLFSLDDDEGLPRHAVAVAAAVDVTVDEMANKLDSLMLLLFQYSGTESSLIAEASIHSFYDVYARSFESSVLITHKSKFVQFLLLYVCGVDSKRLDTRTHSQLKQNHSIPLYQCFVAKLMEFVTDPYRATVTRQTAACYLASFVSRAVFVDAATVSKTVAALLQWSETYLHSIEGAANIASDTKGQCSVHALFYTVCQAAFYIMCFRGPEALSHVRRDSQGTSAIDLTPSRWQCICLSPMQPLLFCLESVRSEFLHLSRVFGLLDAVALDKLIQDNVARTTAGVEKKKSPMKIATAATLENERKRGGVGGLGQGSNPLESFFPFDPYLLRQSHVYVEPFYNHWPGSLEDLMAAADDLDDGSVLIDDEVTDEEVDEASGLDGSGDSSDDEDEDEDEFQPMSLASTGGVLLNESLREGSAANVRDQQRMSWTAALKRDRAPSVEHGSW
ncbi:hypothetical protein MPSEU_000471100 [Mayamaea pseudoterrestris]|nr:hypothetical protein MPSEU_000471100 [Mayamaea pseudoterrestris]